MIANITRNAAAAVIGSLVMLALVALAIFGLGSIASAHAEEQPAATTSSVTDMQLPTL